MKAFLKACWFMIFLGHLSAIQLLCQNLMRRDSRRISIERFSYTNDLSIFSLGVFTSTMFSPLCVIFLKTDNIFFHLTSSTIFFYIFWFYVQRTTFFAFFWFLNLFFLKIDEILSLYWKFQDLFFSQKIEFSFKLVYSTFSENECRLLKWIL